MAKTQEIIRIKIGDPEPIPTSPKGLDDAKKILFEDDFESDLSKWNLDKGNWTTRDSKTSVLYQQDNKVEASAYAGDTEWKNYTVSADFRVLNGYGAILGRIDENGDYYILEIRASSVKLVKWKHGQWKTLSVSDYEFERGNWYNASLSFNKSRIEMKINGETMGDVINDASIEGGIIGLRTSFGELEFDNIKVYE